MTDTLLDLKTVIARTGLPRSTIYRLMAADKFPRQIRISHRCARWSERALASWMEEIAA